MSITITNHAMVSDHTHHTARQLDQEHDTWEVSWLPGHVLDRNQAVTAMTLADTIAEITTDGGLTCTHRAWPLIDALAAELGLSGPAAVARLGA